MVVSRKQPVAPVPPLSRSSSSQPLPTKKQQTKTAAKSAPAVDGKPLKSAPAPAKAKPSKKRKTNSIFDRLFLFSLCGFISYAFYTCRPNPFFPSSQPFSPESALCRSLSTYRTHLLEPYVLPPLQHSLSYTHKISQPYIARTQTHIAPYLEPVQKTLNTLTPYVESTARTTKKVWSGTLIPLYTDTLRPYYETAVVPRYTRYIRPTLVPIQAKAEKHFTYYISKPLQTQLNFLLSKLHDAYTQYIGPYVRVAKPHVQRVYITTSDFISKTWEVYVVHVKPRVLDIWVKARPILCAAWKQYKAAAIRLFEVTKTLVKAASKETAVYRRAYVDPHVRRIWEKVTETNTSDATGTITASPVEMTNAPLVEDLPELPIHQETATVESIPEPTPVVSSTVAALPVTTEVPENDLLVDTKLPIPKDSEAEETTIILEAHGAHVVVPVVPVVDLEPAAVEVEEAKVIPEHERETSTPAAPSIPEPEAPAVEATPEADTAEPTLVASFEQVEAEDDVDDFLKELGVDEHQKGTESENDDSLLSAPEQEQTPEALSPETEAARLAAVATKRAEIVRRHQVWFGTLELVTSTKARELVDILESSRKVAVKEIKAMTSSKDQDGKETGGKIGEVQKEGERLVKGLEGWLKKAEGRSVDWKMPKDGSGAQDKDLKKMKQAMISGQQKKWAQVLGKVEEKFSERVQAFQEEVHTWYVSVREREGDEVLRAGAEVKNIAEQAQADLGLDYAWLDDVTYNDWQKYHDLMRVYERFDQTARSIQNNTSVDPPSPLEPLVPALDDLQKELDDVILGFNVALSKIRSHAGKVFSLRPLEDDEDENEDGFFVVRDGEKRVDDMRGVDLGSVELKKEAVGVLPVKDKKVEASEEGLAASEKANKETKKALETLEKAKLEGAFDAGNVVIIGKDSVQVEQALKDVPVEPAQMRHEEL